jgi:hypothetical protein
MPYSGYRFARSLSRGQTRPDSRLGSRCGCQDLEQKTRNNRVALILVQPGSKSLMARSIRAAPWNCSSWGSEEICSQGVQSSIDALRATVHGCPPEPVPLLLLKPLAALFPLPGRRASADSLLHPRSTAGRDPQSCLDRNVRRFFNSAPLKSRASGDVPLICLSPEVARTR